MDLPPLHTKAKLLSMKLFELLLYQVVSFLNPPESQIPSLSWLWFHCFYWLVSLNFSFCSLQGSNYLWKTIIYMCVYFFLSYLYRCYIYNNVCIIRQIKNNVLNLKGRKVLNLVVWKKKIYAHVERHRTPLFPFCNYLPKRNLLVKHV